MGELSKSSTRAAPCHCNALERIYRYLRQKKSDGIVFWRKEPHVDLPHIPLTCRPLVTGDLDVPYPAAIDQLVGYLDAAHGTCVRTRRSMGAEVFCLAGAAIMYRAKWIVVICTSSTEAEFVVCVRGGKNARYLRSILNEPGVIQTGPTLLNVDNIAAIMMDNAGKPTERSRHIDIQLFALLTCVKAGDILLSHIKGTDNPSVALTKALGWVIHHRHCYRMMGLVGSPYSNTTGHLG
jgi:hypothetical protein